MKRFLIIISILAFALAACGSPSEPALDPAAVQGTAMAAAMTMVAGTQAAIPSATPIPPTIAPSATPFPSSTIGPLGLTTPMGTLGVGVIPTTNTLGVGVIPTNTLPPTAAAPGSGNDPCNKPLTAWDDESAQMSLVNNTKPKGTVTLWMYFYQTQMGSCGYISAQFDSSTTVSVPVGSFTTGAFVDGKKDFKVFGGGTLTRTGNYSLWVDNDAIRLKAGCAPNC